MNEKILFWLNESGDLAIKIKNRYDEFFIKTTLILYTSLLQKYIVFQLCAAVLAEVDLRAIDQYNVKNYT